MTWLHYTSVKIKYIKSDFDQQHYFKPNGLWCSYGDEWLKWHESEKVFTFDPNNYYLYEIAFNPDAKILTIDSFKKYMNLDKYKNTINGMDCLDWNKIKIDYDGVAFLNYQRIKMDMLNSKTIDILILSLDVSSCCIWNHVYKLNLVKHFVNDK
jgi:hypothetical protein